MNKSNPIVDLDEYGDPVKDYYKRLGAGSVSSEEEGLYVRFEPGFGLNVVLGVRWKKEYYGLGPDNFAIKEFPMSIDGWEKLCRFADEWRARHLSPKTMETHLEHYTYCNCLADSGECCRTECHCHDE